MPGRGERRPKKRLDTGQGQVEEKVRQRRLPDRVQVMAEERANRGEGLPVKTAKQMRELGRGESQTEEKAKEMTGQVREQDGTESPAERKAQTDEKAKREERPCREEGWPRRWKDRAEIQRKARQRSLPTKAESQTD